MKRYSILGVAYGVKESFCKIFENERQEEAMEAAWAWKNTIPSEVAWAFHDVLNALDLWWDEIFICWAYPEAVKCQKLTKELSRKMLVMGRGYCFDVIRANLLYATSREGKVDLDRSGGLVSNHAYIPTLIQNLDGGTFD